MQILSQLREGYLGYLEAERITKEPAELYEPVNYIMSLGGKRMRPILTLWACHLFDADWRKALPIAQAVEVFHNFSLVHDDIMDDAPLRRGKPTVHEKWDVNTGILSGDMMLINSYHYLTKVKTAGLIKKLIEIFNRVATEVCEGQQYDINFETQKNVSVPQYMKMIELKTAALLGGAVRLGATVAQAKSADAKWLEKYIRLMGVAFQIQDDLLDTFGDPEKFGKQVGGDILQNKKTYLYLTAVKKANATTKKELKEIYFTQTLAGDEKVERVKAIFKDLEIEKSTLAFQWQLIEKAQTYLEKVNANSTKKEELRNWAETLVIRSV